VTEPRDHRPLVSVVTPVYNGAEFLAECVESVLAQTYERWDYAIVDNCSTDGTLELARSYEARDPRIRVLTPEAFVGAVENANRAVRAISPESTYCKVLHADDWLFPECLERMVELAERHPSVGIVSAYRLEGTKVTLDGLPPEITVLPGREICRSTLLGGPYPYLFGSPSSLLIRSDIVRRRDPFYNADNPFDDDQEACYEVLRESDFGFVHQVLTFTRRPADTPFSTYVKVGAYLPGKIKLHLSYGPYYLRASEHRRQLAVLLARYGLFLAQHADQVRDPDFRRHHAQALAELRRRVDWDDVLAGVGIQLRRMWEGKSLRPGAA
jgi:glycosyltransferase involved in cell wall biosynthesis